MLDRKTVLVVDRDTAEAVKLHLVLPASHTIDWDGSVSQLDDIGDNWAVYQLTPEDEVGECLAECAA